MEAMMITMFMQNLKRDQLIIKSLEPIAEVSTILARIEGLCRKTWEPSDAQFVWFSISISAWHT